MTTIRPYTAADHAAVLDIWRRSVEATHHFLTMGEIAGLQPLVAEMLATAVLEVSVLEDETGSTIAWLGMDGAKIEALFIDPDRRRQGHGCRLVEHAIARHDTLTLDVNEQNPDAGRFYEAMGFTITGRSPLDGQGNPFPLLHMVRHRAPAAG
jgi:putative acetyltransferase